MKIHTKLLQWIATEGHLTEDDLIRYADSFDEIKETRSYIGWSGYDILEHSYDSEHGSIETDFIILDPDGKTFFATCSYYTESTGYQWDDTYVELEEYYIPKTYKNLELNEEITYTLNTMISNYYKKDWIIKNRDMFTKGLKKIEEKIDND
jgi:hypothetical protein